MVRTHDATRIHLQTLEFRLSTEFLTGRCRPLAPKVGSPEWEKATKYWASLQSDPGAVYDLDVLINAADIVPTVT